MGTPQVRRIELFALPFMAGIAAVMAVPPAFRCGILFHSSVFILCAAMLFVDLLLIRTRGLGDTPTGLVPVTAALCAAVCVLRSEATSLTDVPMYERAASWLHLDRLCAGFRAAIDSIPLDNSENNALLKALLTGDRSCLSAQTVMDFRDSGASHILALSGLHLGIIYGIVTKVFSVIGNSPAAKRTRSLLNLAATGTYCLMVGAGPSISRAFLFILLRETAALSGRSASLRDILCGAFVIQVCMDATAVTSLSFQLSYLAIAGIAYIYPAISRIWAQDQPRRSPLRWIWDSAAVSISCQATTGPLAFLRFGTFPKYFLLTNLLALPLTGLLIPSALLTALLSALNICPSPAVHLTDFLATLLRTTLRIISGM